MTGKVVHARFGVLAADLIMTAVMPCFLSVQSLY